MPFDFEFSSEYVHGDVGSGRPDRLFFEFCFYDRRAGGERRNQWHGEGGSEHGEGHEDEGTAKAPAPGRL